jgi:hypothetical protein
MLNDALMIGIVLTLVFGAVIFYLYNRLSLAERKMGLVEGMLTDMKVMFDSAPMVSEPVPYRGMEGGFREFEPTPELIQAISGPHPIAKEEAEELTGDEYQQTLEEALEGVLKKEQLEGGTTPYRTLQIDEALGQGVPGASPVQVTKLAPDLDSMTVNELKALAKEKNVSIPAGTRRKDIIELIRKASGGTQGTPLSELDGPEPPAGGASLEESEVATLE